MSWLLNAIYVAFLILASPWLLWRRLWQGKSRRGWSQKLFGWVPRRKKSGQAVWLHAVSVGEIILLQTVVKELLDQQPELEICISTSTETGFDLASKRFDGHTVFFCPFDFTWAVQAVINRIQPSVVMLAELEIWPNLISTVRKNDIPIGIVNGRLSSRSFHGYRRFQFALQSVFGKLSFVCVQNASYAERFIELGCQPESVHVTGSVKFDGLETNRQNTSTMALKSAARIRPQQHVFVAGSTQPDENEMVAEIYHELSNKYPNLRLVVVPRHPKTCDELQRRLEKLKMPVVRRSEFTVPDPGRSRGNEESAVDVDSSGPGEGAVSENAVIIVDVIGELAAWWGVADVAYVGGSMGSRGGQNMLEPAAFGVPVSFGPNTENFAEIVETLLQSQAAEVVRNGAELRRFVETSIPEYNSLMEMGKRARALVLTQAGAGQRTVEIIRGTLGFDLEGDSADRNRDAA